VKARDTYIQKFDSLQYSTRTRARIKLHEGSGGLRGSANRCVSATAAVAILSKYITNLNLNVRIVIVLLI